MTDETFKQGFMVRLPLSNRSWPKLPGEDHRLVTKESTHHANVFLLFQIEFVQESKVLPPSKFPTFLGLVQAQREHCAQLAALQRIAHSLLVQQPQVSASPDVPANEPRTQAVLI